MKQHEHEFDGEPDVTMDGCIIAEQRCTYREIRGSKHSERHDETFYNEGPRCNVVRRAVFDLERIEGPDWILESDDDSGEHVEANEAWIVLVSQVESGDHEIFIDDEELRLDVEHRGKPFTFVFQSNGVEETRQ